MLARVLYGYRVVGDKNFQFLFRHLNQNSYLFDPYVQARCSRISMEISCVTTVWLISCLVRSQDLFLLNMLLKILIEFSIFTDSLASLDIFQNKICFLLSIEITACFFCNNNLIFKSYLLSIQGIIL